MKLFSQIILNPTTYNLDEKTFDKNYGNKLIEHISQGANINDHLPTLLLTEIGCISSPLICALIKIHHPLVRFLLKNGANPYAKQIFTNTSALEIAINMASTSSTENSEKNVHSIYEYIPINYSNPSAYFKMK